MRVIQLSKHNVAVQPYYLTDYKNRNSIKRELDAISEITHDIHANPETVFDLKPLIIIDVKTIKPGLDIIESYQRLAADIALGSQYEWLAEFAKSNPGIELTIESGGRLTDYFAREGNLEIQTLAGISYMAVDREVSNRDMITIFGNFHLPYPIKEMTKLEMVDEYHKLGFSETMLKTWFCHNPVSNQPCGVCTPCKQVIEKGLSYRIPPAGLKRYETDKKYQKHWWFRIWKKIRLRIRHF